MRKKTDTRKTDRKPVLGFLSAHGGYGGTEEYLDKLMRRAAQEGYRVVFFHPADSPRSWVERVGRHAETVRYTGANGSPDADPPAGGHAHRSPLQAARRFHRAMTPWQVRFVLGFCQQVMRMRRVFRKRPVDALHFSDLGADPPIMAARMAGIPRLSGALNCIPGTGGKRDTHAFRLLERLCLSRLDAITAVSQAGLDLWKARVPLNQRKARVVHNGTEIPRLSGVEQTAAEVRAELGIPGSAKIVGVSATLAERKGHRCLLRAFARALPRAEKARLVLAGDGPRRAALERQARRLGIEREVHFLGHRNDVARIVQAYDVVALTSVAIESLPFSVLEGMSYGKPALVTAVGGMPELVQDGVSGFVVPPRDTAAMADAMGRLLGDGRLAGRMGRAARRRVEQEFSADRMARETLAVMLAGTP